MKLIRAFILFVLISLFVGIGSAFNGQSTAVADIVDDEVVEKEVEINSNQVENVESSNVEKESTEIVDNNSKSEEKSTSISSNLNQEKNKSTEKVETSKKEEQQTVDKTEITNNEQQETSTITNPPVQEETKKLEVWDELGITEYEYYHSPMVSWQKVTHTDFNSCYVAGEDATSFKVNEQTGEWYQDYTDYWCYEVKSYSGDLLGVMLSLS